MDFQGKVIQFIGETTGVSKAGKPWKKKEWVVEIPGAYPRKVKVQCFGDRADAMNLELGKDYNLYVDLESREFNGRWYTDVSVYRADEVPGGIAQPFPGQQPGGYQQPQSYQQPGMNQPPYPQGGFSETSFTATVEESDEDLPF